MVHPGKYLTVDESFSFMDQGLTSHLDDGDVIGGAALPHTSKNPKKPLGIGCELKTCADAASKVMLHLDIVRAAADNSKIRYGKDNPIRIQNAIVSVPYHVAITLRAVESWFGTKRTVVADSAFSSVMTAYWLYVAGLNFLGIVKTATRMYPN